MAGRMLSAEERKRQRELEEARKAGLAAPEQRQQQQQAETEAGAEAEADAAAGRMEAAATAECPAAASVCVAACKCALASAPWYLNQDKPGLKHQKNWKDEVKDAKTWYDRGAKVFQANKWRKGACENCGSMAHKTRECMERPRTKGARFTHKNIAADEKVEDIELATWDAKRDRWNGYNPDEWAKQADRFEKVAEMRQEIRRRELLEGQDGEDSAAAAAPAGGEGAAGAVDGELAKEEDKVDEADVTEVVSSSWGGAEQVVWQAGRRIIKGVLVGVEICFAKVEKRVRTAGGGATMSVRNLRIREDTAKYLLNLDTNSAYYDPKSRSMREDPNPQTEDAKRIYQGETFERGTGEVKGFGALNLFAVTAFEKGQDVHMQAMPSQAELAFRQFKQRKESAAQNSKASVAERYGDGGAQALPEDLKALAQTEAYVEYDAAGRVIKGQEVKARSRYEEDVYINNHTSVWGSWWHEGQWGYACCHSTVKNSYCTGQVGTEAAAEAAEQLQRNLESKMEERQAAAEEAAAEGKRLEGVKPKANVWGTEMEEGLQLDEAKVREALKRQEQEERRRQERGGDEDTDDRKRRYNSLREEHEVTPEEMEAYRLKKSRGDDPLEFMKAAKESAAAVAGGGGGYDYV
ncbi:hypothetical protein N2152v2_008225 [Parachlorella kessleri]